MSTGPIVLKPDYAGGSIANLMASLAAGLDGDPGALAPLRQLDGPAVAGYRQVLLMVIDGLGYDFLRVHQRHAPTLHAHLESAMTSVFPATTAAAVGTFLTGLPPATHGLTGWHMYVRGLASVLAVLPGRARAGVSLYHSAQQVRELLDVKPFVDRIGVPATMVTPASIADSAFNRAHAGSADVVAYDDLAQMFESTVAALSGSGRRYVYSYWPDLDSTAHRCGMGSEPTLELLRELDREFAAMLDRLDRSDTLVVLTADHGHVNTDDAESMVINEHEPVASRLLLPLCGEPRAAFAYVQPRARASFEAAVREHLGDALHVCSSEQALEEEWFGPGPVHPELATRIGDFVLLPEAQRMVRDWLPGERRYRLHSAHGGFSAAEMRVPLVLA